MSIKLADSLVPMSNDFPAVEGSYVDVTINGATERLQDAIDNGDLAGGGSTIQVDLLPAPSVDELGKIYEFIGSTGTYVNGYFYECVSDGETPPTYSWVQKNVQPSNSTASDSSYDNTTSGLTATNVQDAIDEIHGGLGTASGKNFTDLVRPNSHELVESGSVYSAINNALSSIYTPRGELTCAELTSSLLIEDNVGNIYTMSDSGTTSALFINGAGLTINIGDNVGIIKAGADTYLFNYMGNAFDLTDYQKKDLSSPIAGASTVEGAIAQNTSDIEKIKAYTAVSNTDANTLTTTGLYYLTTGCTNIPSAYCILQVQSKNTTSISDDIAQYTVNTEGDQYSRVRVNGTWSTWQKLATTSDTDYFYQTSDVEGEYDANDFAVIGKITRYCVKSPVHGYQVDGTSWWGFYETARFRDGGYGYQTFRTMLGSPVMAIRQFYGGNWTEWKQLATTDNISDYVRNNVFYVGDRRNIIGWADLSNSVDIDGSSNYANNIGRIEGRNAIIEVSNPNIGYQWPVTNSGDSNKFMDFGGAIQFFVDKVNNHLYVRFADSVDMSAWGEIATKQDLGYAKFPTIVTNSTQAVKITRNSVSSGSGKYVDVFGNVFMIGIGDQLNRFFVTRALNCGVADITTFARDMSAMYIYSDTYQLHFLELLGDLSYEVIAKSAIPSGAETVTIQ